MGQLYSYEFLGGTATPTFRYRQSIAIAAHSYISAAISNFPHAIVIDNNARWATFWSHVDSVKGYVYFTDASGTALHFRVRKWDYAGQSAVFIVQVPTLSASAATTIYISYDYIEGGAPPFNFLSPYDANYVCVLPLSVNAEGGAFDDEADVNDGTDSGTADGAGALDRGRSYSAAVLDDRITFATYVLPKGPKSVSLFVNTTNLTNSPYVLDNTGDASSANHGWFVRHSSDGRIQVVSFSGGGTRCSVFSIATLSQGTLGMIGFTWDGTTVADMVKNYMNGVGSGTGTAGSQETVNPSDILNLGSVDNVARPFVAEYRGVLSELRISNVARSASWMRMEYQSIIGANDWTVYLTLGNAEGMAADTTWQTVPKGMKITRTVNVSWRI